MSKMNDGGPAFPVGVPIEFQVFNEGMSFRDWSAVQIAAGMAAYSGTCGPGFGPGEIAKRAYEVADAMLAERERQP